MPRVDAGILSGKAVGSNPPGVVADAHQNEGAALIEGCRVLFSFPSVLSVCLYVCNVDPVSVI